MEVRINKEIREYTENMFFGLSLRQFLCSLMACAVAVFIYFLLYETVHLEMVSWVCIFAVTPFVMMGFVKYHGMTAEQLVWVWIKFKFLYPKRFTFRSSTLYYDSHKEVYAAMTKEVLKRHD